MKFKQYLQNMISNVQFTRVNNDFQKRIKNDINQSSHRMKFSFSHKNQERFMK